MFRSAPSERCQACERNRLGFPRPSPRRSSAREKYHVEESARRCVFPQVYCAQTGRELDDPDREVNEPLFKSVGLGLRSTCGFYLILHISPRACRLGIKWQMINEKWRMENESTRS